MIKNRFISLAAALLLTVHAVTQKVPSLKETFKNDFLIGAALNPAQIREQDANANKLIQQQFNAATPENSMKAGPIHHEWNRYDFELADKLVAYGQKHQETMKPCSNYF